MGLSSLRDLSVSAVCVNILQTEKPSSDQNIFRGKLVSYDMSTLIYIIILRVELKRKQTQAKPRLGTRERHRRVTDVWTSRRRLCSASCSTTSCSCQTLIVPRTERAVAATPAWMECGLLPSVRP